MNNKLIKHTDLMEHPEDVKRPIHPCDDVITLKIEGKDQGKRLTALEQIVKDNDILVKDALGIRERINGDRQKQIQDALKRISEIGEKTEDEDKSLRELIIENKVEVAEIKGYIQGQDVKTSKHDKAEDKLEVKHEQRITRRDKYFIAAFTAVIAPLLLLLLIFLINTFH